MFFHNMLPAFDVGLSSFIYTEVCSHPAALGAGSA